MYVIVNGHIVRRHYKVKHKRDGEYRNRHDKRGYSVHVIFVYGFRFPARRNYRVRFTNHKRQPADDENERKRESEIVRYHYKIRKRYNQRQKR
jgi:hypothetical protein